METMLRIAKHARLRTAASGNMKSKKLFVAMHCAWAILTAFHSHVPNSDHSTSVLFRYTDSVLPELKQDLTSF